MSEVPSQSWVGSGEFIAWFTPSKGVKGVHVAYWTGYTPIPPSIRDVGPIGMKFKVDADDWIKAAPSSPTWGVAGGQLPFQCAFSLGDNPSVQDDAPKSVESSGDRLLGWGVILAIASTLSAGVASSIGAAHELVIGLAGVGTLLGLIAGVAAIRRDRSSGRSDSPWSSGSSSSSA